MTILLMIKFIVRRSDVVNCSPVVNVLTPMKLCDFICIQLFQFYQYFQVFHLIQGVTNIAAVSLQIGYPTAPSVPHSIINGFKVSIFLSAAEIILLFYYQNVLAIALATDITFKEAEQVDMQQSIQQSMISFQSSLNIILQSERNTATMRLPPSL